MLEMATGLLTSAIIVYLIMKEQQSKVEDMVNKKLYLYESMANQLIDCEKEKLNIYKEGFEQGFYAKNGFSATPEQEVVYVNVEEEEIEETDEPEDEGYQERYD